MLLKKLRMMIILVLITIGSFACTCDPIIIPPTPLPISTRPVLPAINADEIKSIPSKELRIKIIERDKLRKGYAEKLEAIIQSTHTK